MNKNQTTSSALCQSAKQTTIHRKVTHSLKTVADKTSTVKGRKSPAWLLPWAKVLRTLPLGWPLRTLGIYTNWDYSANRRPTKETD